MFKLGPWKFFKNMCFFLTINMHFLLTPSFNLVAGGSVKKLLSCPYNLYLFAYMRIYKYLPV